MIAVFDVSHYTEIGAVWQLRGCSSSLYQVSITALIQLSLGQSRLPHGLPSPNVRLCRTASESPPRWFSVDNPLPFLVLLSCLITYILIFVMWIAGDSCRGRKPYRTVPRWRPSCLEKTHSPFKSTQEESRCSSDTLSYLWELWTGHWGLHIPIILNTS